MNVFIHRLATYVPPHTATQDSLAARFGEWAQDPSLARVIGHIFRKTGIHRRYSVLPDFTEPDQAELFRVDSAGQLSVATTQARNRVYGRHAAPIAVQLAQELLDHHSSFEPDEVTHVITVSCTGFVNPGPDWAIVTELGLPPTVERYHIGFMGCYAALPALRMARQFCLAQPDAVVLVVCLELCSLHMQMQTTNDSILGNALFSDGAAAALVSARHPAEDQAVLALDGFRSAMAPEGRGEMAWEIGDHGFNLVLSSYVPDVISANLGRIVDDLLLPRDLVPDDIDLWAVHPGGKAILDKFEKSAALRPAQIEASRAVLRDFGNMSSATILFVFQRMLEQSATTSPVIAAMAFGPGLTVECGLLRVVPGRRPAPVLVREPALALAAL
jgi:predicted naringenin-chalcone synthase